MDKKLYKKNVKNVLKFLSKLSFDLLILCVLTLFLMGSIEVIYKNNYNEDLFNYEENICKTFNCNFKEIGFSGDYNLSYYNMTNLDRVYYKLNNLFIEEIVLRFYEIGKKNPIPFFIIYFLYLLYMIYSFVFSPIYKKLKGGKKKDDINNYSRSVGIGSGFWN